MESKVWMFFVALAGLSWGVYVPLIAQGGKELKNSYASFLCVGIAYFITAVLIPLGLIFINVAGGETVRIRELAQEIAEIAGYSGTFRFDTSKPDGMPWKVLDGSRIRAAGWQPSTSLREGLARTWQWFRANSREMAVRG